MMTDAEAKSMQKSLMKIAPIWNTHPYRVYEARAGGRMWRIPPQGQVVMPSVYASLLLGKDRESDKKVRGWLTMVKEEFEAAAEFLKVNNMARNLVDPDVRASVKDGKYLTFVIPPESLAKIESEEAMRALDIDVHEPPAAKPEKKRAKDTEAKEPIEVSL